MCPHHLGCVADLEEILQFGVPVLEDCARAPGATYRGRPVGTWESAGAFSFYPTKVMAAIEADLLAAARDKRYYGGIQDDQYRFNYKLSNLNAAVGLVQLNRLPEMLKRRRAIGRRYAEALQARGGVVQGSVVFRFGLRTRWGSAGVHLEIK